MAAPRYLLNPTVGVRGNEPTRPFRLILVVRKDLMNALSYQQRIGVDYVRVVGNMAHVDISNFVTSLSWGASEQDFYANLRLQLNNFEGVFNRIPMGSQIQLQLRSPFYPSVSNPLRQSRWLPYLNVYWFEKTRSAEGPERTMDVTLYDRLYWLNEFPIHVVYKKDKKRKKQGWTATEVIRHVCAEFKIPVGTIPRTKFKLPRMENKTTLLKFIRAVLAEDKKGSKRKSNFTIDMLDGKLNIRPDVGIPRSAYFLDETTMLESGTLKEALEKEKFATRVVVTADQVYYKKDSRGNRVKQVKPVRAVANASAEVQQVYGVRPKNVKLKGLHSIAEIRNRAQTELEKAVKPTQEFSVTVRGIPGMWPGKKVFIQSRYFGIRGLLKVTSVQYDATATTLSMTLGLKTDTRALMTMQERKALTLSEVPRY